MGIREDVKMDGRGALDWMSAMGNRIMQRKVNVRMGKEVLLESRQV